MKTKLNVVFFTLFSLCSYGSLAEIDNPNNNIDPFYLKHPFLCLSPQFGFDIGFTKTKFDQDHNYKMFDGKQFPITGYFNVSFNDKFGIEIGYTMPKRKRNTTVISEGEFYPGSSTSRRVAPGETKYYSSSIELRQPYIGLKYDFHFNNHKPYLFGVIGVTSAKVRAQWGQFNTEAAASVFSTKRIFEFRKNIPFIKLGAYIPLTWWNEHLSMRVATTWFKTSMLKNSIPGYSATDDIATIKAKNSIHYSIGLAYSI